MSEPFTNRLIHEKSPYLLQHAHNPIDWYPWGDEAFSAAVRHNKPIFLSIGYSTCHFCHVMEQEAFSDEEIAKRMNALFVCIKVDREERPDIDSLYMDFAQALMPTTPGWPLNLLLTPELRPFYAATYLPKESVRGGIGIKELMDQVERIWKGEEKEAVELQAEHVVSIFNQNVSPQGDDLPHEDVIYQVAETFFHEADPLFGGLRGSPKFPMGYQSSFLLHFYSRYHDIRALYWVEKCLNMMKNGGIHDHLGGGFHRYSTDEMWEVPHFEKMLYDNALIATAYFEAWQLTKNEAYQKVCKKTLRYLLSEMQDHSTGAFYSAQDADSEGIEGKYYTWTFDEVKAVLGLEDAKLLCQYYGVVVEGSVEGRSVLRRTMSVKQFAERMHLDEEETEAKFQAFEEKLLQRRRRRTPPLKDDKVLLSWNGLVIEILARAGVAFQEEIMLDAAKRAARFIIDHLWDGKKLKRRYRDGEASIAGCLDDYAFFIRATLTLFEVTGESEYLRLADQLNRVLSETFKAHEGAFYETDGKDTSIIIRKCALTDGAEPSGNGVQTENLLRFYQLTHAEIYLKEAEDVISATAPLLEKFPTAFAYHMIAYLRYFNKKAMTLVIALNEQEDYRQELEQLIFQSFIPDHVVIFRTTIDQELFSMIPYVEKMGPIDGKTTFYPCIEKVCLEPMTEYEKMVEAIERLKP